MSLVTIAKQQGWTLDLAALQRQLDEHALSRYSGDALAAQAAVLLAKTQATAARVESRDLLRRLREATATAEAERAARAEAAESLAGVQRELEEARRNQAVAEARLTELTTRLSSDDQHVQFMVDRIKSLEQERHRLNRSLGWFGRFRYRRLVERDLSRPSPKADRSASDRDLVEASDRPAGEPTALDPHRRAQSVDLVDGDPGAVNESGQGPIPAPGHPPSRVPMTPPPVQITNASTVANAADTISHRSDEADDRDEPGRADRLRGRYIQVPRTPDGRFDRSALAAARSSAAVSTS